MRAAAAAASQARFAYGATKAGFKTARAKPRNKQVAGPSSVQLGPAFEVVVLCSFDTRPVTNLKAELNTRRRCVRLCLCSGQERRQAARKQDCRALRYYRITSTQGIAILAAFCGFLVRGGEAFERCR
eukprot:scaffold340_cov256-Pinguiococcus_pyrenoidosus.AAC.13